MANPHRRDEGTQRVSFEVAHATIIAANARLASDNNELRAEIEELRRKLAEALRIRGA